MRRNVFYWIRSTSLGVLLLCIMLIGNYKMVDPVYAGEIIENASGSEFETENETEIETIKPDEGSKTDNSEKNEKPDTSRIEVKELDLGDYKNTMQPDEKQLLMVTPIPINATDQEITFSSSNTDVATVNGLGRITAIKEGKVKITVTCGGVSQSFTLTVKYRPEEIIEEPVIEVIAVKDIEFSDHEDKLPVGEVMNLTATVLPADATAAQITFESSNSSIATVNSSGEVKGIAKGNVTISATAGGITRKVLLNIYVKTNGINVEKDYLVLKPGEEIQLKPEVLPKDAEQKLTYKSSDSEKVTVNSEGLVHACESGNAAILISNGDMTISVSVIVGKANEKSVISETTDDAENATLTNYDVELQILDYPIITKEMLCFYYENRRIVCLQGKDYSLLLDGNEIVNVHNQLLTDLQITEEKDGISFVLNDTQYLPGPVTVCFENEYGKYLYLYNTAKERYERIVADDIQTLKLTSAGKYLITQKKLWEIDWLIVGLLILGSVVTIAGGITYIVLKKKYWFW